MADYIIDSPIIQSKIHILYVYIACMIEAIRQPISTAFNALSRDDRHDLISGLDSTIAFQRTPGSGINYSHVRDEAKRLSEMGFCTIGPGQIISAMCICASRLQIEIPHADYRTDADIDQLSKNEKKRVLGDQRNAINEIFDHLSIGRRPEGFSFYFQGEDENGDPTTELIGDEAQWLLENNPEIVEYFASFQGVINKTLQIIRELSKTTDALTLLSDSPSQALRNGPVIAVNGRGPMPASWLNSSDVVVPSTEPKGIHAQVLRETIYHAQMLEQRRSLQVGINNGSIKLEPEFTPDRWPTHPLMSHLKSQAAKVVIDVVNEMGLICDPQDARYQTIFRLTTYPLHLIFNDGGRLHEYLNNHGVYSDWRKILTLDPGCIGQFNINEDLVRDVAREQLIIINDRLSKSPLPVEKLLTRTGIFSEIGWVMEKEEGEVYAVRRDGNGLIIDRKEVDFVEVGESLATEYHHAFHYIHTPRSGKAFGLYLRGDEWPFSVLALEPIDRSYKQNMLLAQGYDPRHCMDLARLYSRPGTPFNTSSTMFSLVFGHLRSHNPEIRALLSAFMPTYANGMSMMSGGFDHPVLIKPNNNTFGLKNIGNRAVYEHLTKRRLQEANEFIQIHTDIPMLPVVELMAPLRPPRFEPLNGIQGKMVCG